MQLNKLVPAGIVAIAMVAAAWAPQALAALPMVIPLFHKEPAGAVTAAQHWYQKNQQGVGWRTKISGPTLTVFLPKKANANGAAVVICPGGAYVGEAMNLEGYQPAHWLNSIGVAACVLTYMLPRGRATLHHMPAALLDAQRAMRLVRQNARKWHIYPKRVGIMGFSAGGSLAGLVGTHFTKPNPHATKKINRFSDRPAFMVLMYPVISMEPSITHWGSRIALLGKHPSPAVVRYYSDELHVTRQTPPAFLCAAKDDPAVNLQNSIRFYKAEKKLGKPTELIFYPKGGHGFGLGIGKGRVSHWPKRCAAWLKKLGFLGHQG